MVEFNEINTAFYGMESNLKDLYSQQEVKSEIHHLQKAEDLHFYMVKVTGKNAKDCDNFFKEQRKVDDTRLSIGLKAFGPSLPYHDQDLTDTYVAFITNKLWDWDKTEKPDSSSIEMSVTAMTVCHECKGSYMKP